MKILPEIAAFAALAAVLAGAIGVQGRGAAADPQATVGNSFAIRDARVFDGTRVLSRANVVVVDGLISAVGVDAPIPAGLAALDGRGKTVLPGFIDAHTHSWGDAQRDALRFGVTTELDMMGDRSRARQLRAQRQSLARTDQADLWSAGAAVTAPGGHGTQYGMQVPTLAAGQDAPAFVDARVAEGSDYIKLIIEDMSVYDSDRRLPTITAAQAGEAIEAAHAAGRLALVHASSQDTARMALQAGADGLVHVFQDAAADAALVDAARSRDAFVVPTLSVIASMAGAGDGGRLQRDARLQPWFTAAQADRLKSGFGGQGRPDFLQRALESVRSLHEAGVDILAGTDAGNPGTAHGASLHGELELLVRAGLTPLQSLMAATSLPARRFGLADRGRLAVGLRADMVMVEGDPTSDITTTRAITGVWKNGYAIARPRAEAAGAAPALASGTLVSDFEDDRLLTRYGGAWQETSDQMAGGASRVTQQWIELGASGSRGALAVSGEVLPGFAYPWAGTMFFPTTTPMQAVDASSRSELVFQVRGDGRRYSAMLFSGGAAQSMPSIQAFTAGEQWSEVRLPLAGFAGADLARLRGIAFTAGQPQGEFAFAIDQVELR